MQAEKHAFFVTDSSLWLILVAQSDAKTIFLRNLCFIKEHAYPQAQTWFLKVGPAQIREKTLPEKIEIDRNTNNSKT